MLDQYSVEPEIEVYVGSRSGDKGTDIPTSPVMDSIYRIVKIANGYASLEGVRPTTTPREVLLANFDPQFRGLFDHEKEELKEYLDSAERACAANPDGPWELVICPLCQDQIMYPGPKGPHYCFRFKRTVYSEHLLTIAAGPVAVQTPA